MVTELLSGPSSIVYTHHAELRMAQRNLDRKDIDYTMRHGCQFHCAGVVHIHLRGKDIPVEDRTDSAIIRLEGATVVMDPDESVVITVWRNRERGVARIRRKRRYEA